MRADRPQLKAIRKNKMDKLKYVVDDCKTFLIFHHTVVHRDVARHLMGEPVGAGFCKLRADKSGKIDVECWGESVSLDIKSRKEDQKIISEHINY